MGMKINTFYSMPCSSSQIFPLKILVACARFMIYKLLKKLDPWTCCNHWVVTIIAQKVVGGWKTSLFEGFKKTWILIENGLKMFGTLEPLFLQQKYKCCTILESWDKMPFDSTNKWTKKSLHKLLRACQKR